ncbi:MAG: PstS family phosphate ABC transporter substrate-binding protein [Actinomycetota bacterium]|nr:PstS family phosphate ABC transporter substrate-binding protein [Actinomycetota bacterium]
MRGSRFTSVLAVCGTLALGATACGGGGEEPAGSGQAEQQTSQELSGSIQIDGSSTVQPFAEAAAELFGEEAPEVQIQVGGAGTGDGFERFCAGETQIANASRPIEDDERQSCRQNDIRPVEVQVANDGIAVVTNPELQVDCLTTAQLKRLLRPNSRVTNLSQLGGGLPDRDVSFFTPGAESGTFDFFTEKVLETDGEQRQQGVQTSANDNQLITGVSGTQGALGYVGFSYAQEQQGKLNLAAVNGGDGCVRPSLETIQDGSYAPLARPLYMYPSQQAMQRPEVRAFMRFVAENQQAIAEAAKVVPMTAEQAQAAQSKLGQAG